MTIKQNEWTKATASGDGGSVEVMFLPGVSDDGGTVLVRDGKRTDGPRLAFNRAEWLAFLAGVTDREFDLS